MLQTNYVVDFDTLYLIYDGDCPLCKNTALAVRIKQSITHFVLINARDSHPIREHVIAQGYDLDQGILIIYQGKTKQGRAALVWLTQLCAPDNIFNRSAIYLFQKAWRANLLYPCLKGIRRTLLWLRGRQLIQQAPQTVPTLYQQICLQTKAHAMHPLFKSHYNIHFNKIECIGMRGKLDISFSKTYSNLKPLFRLIGFSIDQQGDNISTQVELISQLDSTVIAMNRILSFKPKKIQVNTMIKQLSATEFIEITNNLFCWKFRYKYKQNTLSMHHIGYGVMLGRCYIPIPGVRLLLGTPYAEETAINEYEFAMQTHISHWLSKKLLCYHGTFKIIT